MACSQILTTRINMTIYFLNHKKILMSHYPIFVNTFLIGTWAFCSFFHCLCLFWQYGDRVEEIGQRTCSLQSLRYHLVLRKTLPPLCSEDTVMTGTPTPDHGPPLLLTPILCHYLSIHPLSSHIFIFSFSSQFFFQGST